MKQAAKPDLFTELTEQYKLLQQEYEWEKESYIRQSQQEGIERKIRQGLCWYPVYTGPHRYNSLNQIILEVNRPEEDTEHLFEYNRPVCFFSVDYSGKQHFFPFKGKVSYAENNRLFVNIPGLSVISSLEHCNNLGIQLWFDETTYKTMFRALQEVQEAKNNRLAHLRDVLLGNLPFSTGTVTQLRFPWLNPSQERAVNQVLNCKEIAIIHGPPGTGKTTTLVEAIYETLKRENQVLVCAQSNMAVDWISEKLMDRGIKVLRIGNPSRVNDKMLSFTYERQFESHPAYPELWGFRKRLRELSSVRQKGSSGASLSQRIHELRQRAMDIEIKIKEDLFREARVIACTLVGADQSLLEKKYFSSLFIDEAAQALEAACWIAIRKASRVIFAGDHWQLPPTIKCPEAAQKGLSHTLMQKASERKPDCVSLLEIQYRMHDDIMAFPSSHFYHNRLKSAPEVKHRNILEYDTPVEWYDTSECEWPEEFPQGSPSHSNPSEARLLLQLLKDYILRIGPQRIVEEQIDFGLISPYKSQIHLLRRLLKSSAFFTPFRSLLTVNTVDGFQGQERDAILISLVRANREGDIGFLRDLRRMNVAMTRARMKLIIIGDASTLTKHPFYRDLYRYIATKGQIIPVSQND